MQKREPFFWIMFATGLIIMVFLVLPMIKMITAPSFAMLMDVLRDRDVIRSIRLSILTAGSAALISFLFGTPLAYLLARHDFFGKRLVESIIDLPVVIPHPVVGIAILSVAGRDFWLGAIMQELGIRIMGSVTGIITVLTFVGIPFYINAAKSGFESISPRIEYVSRSLGASMFGTFCRVTFPLAWRSIVVGFVMCMARAISEFGAVVIVAYHPMIAPVMIYERFEGYGLKYSQPVAVWLVTVCLSLFLVLRILTLTTRNKA